MNTCARGDSRVTFTAMEDSGTSFLRTASHRMPVKVDVDITWMYTPPLSTAAAVPLTLQVRLLLADGVADAIRVPVTGAAQLQLFVL